MSNSIMQISLLSDYLDILGLDIWNNLIYYFIIVVILVIILIFSSILTVWALADINKQVFENTDKKNKYLLMILTLGGIGAIIYFYHRKKN